jgi:hypothetical protein
VPCAVQNDGKDRGSVGGSTASATREIEAKRKAAMGLVTTGALFKKFKHGSGKERMIWVPSTVDRIIWGDKSKKNVKGFIMINEVKSFASGTAHAGSCPCMMADRLFT